MGKRSKGTATAKRPARKAAGGLDSMYSETRRGTTGEMEAAPTGWLAIAQQEILTPTYWFDAGDGDEPYAVTICFSGRRVGITGKAQDGDTFSQEQIVEGIVPGSGLVAVTTRVRGINPGEWVLNARPAGRRSSRLPRAEPRAQLHATDTPPRGRTVWPGRAPQMQPGVESPTATQLPPFSRVPGMLPPIYLAWPTLIGLGVVAGLALQAMLLAHMHRPISAALLVSLVALVVGCVGAKTWYIVVYRAQKYDGWCIQGFILGAALVAGTLPLAMLQMPVGVFLDAAAPGLLLGMSVGRPGCFLAGCCSGRPTASRWGLWSSDQCLATRRIPTQLMEAVLCLTIGVVTLILILASPPGRPGVIFAGALATYTLGRQFLLPLRAEPRKTSMGRFLTIGASSLVLVTAIVLGIAD